MNNFLNIKGESENENVKRSRREIGMFKGKSVYSEFLTYNIASAVVPMIIILTVINSYYRTTMVREYENSVNILAEMNKFKIENIFGKYSNALKYILTDENIKENIYKYSTLKDSGDNGAYKYYDKANNELKKLFSQIGDFRFIYQNNGGAIAAQWMDGMEKTKDAVSFSNEFVMFFDSAEREYICSIGKRLSLSSDNYFKKIGYCTLQFGCGGLIKDISAPYSGSFFEIVNENRIIASSTDKYNIGKRADNNDEYIIKNFPLDKYKAEIRIRSSKEPMKRILFICTMIFFAVICLILSAVCVISYGISNYIAEPVISTRYALINDFNVEIKRKHRDEFEELKEAVDEMKQRIKKLINEVYEHEILEKDLQMEALRAQIQPHFLYNVFEVINAMIDLEDDRVSELIILLSDFFRNGISIDKTEITLEDEIKYSNIYLDIQKFILGDRLSVTEHIDERCLNKPIIRFVIQPILENAFKHGVFRKNKKIKIKINVLYVKNGKMKIYISDNGAGMDEELRLKLIEYINGRSTDFKGVGLKNINERLILHYGKEYGLKIHSKVNKGSIFVITIPCD